MAEFTLRIDGMHCGSCVRRVTQALNPAGDVEVEEVRIGAARLKSPDDEPSRGCRDSCSCQGRLQRTIGAISRKMDSIRDRIADIAGHRNDVCFLPASC